MGKYIWIWNHYATPMFESGSGRHYWFAKELENYGFESMIFCSNATHKSFESIDTKNKKYTIDSKNGVPFVFVKTNKSNWNGYERILSMISFFINLFPVSKDIYKKVQRPDIILASSVHPLTMLAGILIGKRLNIPVICEVRDLWPETLVEMGYISRNSFVTKILYSLEKYIYKKADRLIFTMPGGKDYIKKIGLDNDKVKYINNGTDLDTYNYNKEKYIFRDLDLEDPKTFKVLYTGSMGQANELSYVIEAASILKNKGINNIKFILFGDGNQREELESTAINNELDNIIFKGKIERRYIPNVLSKGNLNIFTGKHIDLYKYGLSLNKMFDYFASGKPTLSNIETGYDMLERYKNGMTVPGNNSEALVEGILKFYNMSKKEYENYCVNAKNTAEIFDYQILTKDLVSTISELI